ncbi:MAG: hypothetical protein J4473_00140 [Candidatus Aenigmarchaeota archaeon]|nr:hypothetical protein [Candidatus Aenigmarchaeota archaeon]
MPVLGILLNEIEGKNNNKQAEGMNINVNTTPKIERIKKSEIDPNIKDVLSVEFSFATNYSPDIGEINMKGEVLYKAKNADKIVKNWDDTGKADDDMIIEILNAILRKCVTEAVSLSNQMRLPPPIRFPMVKKQDQSGKKVKDGVEDYAG